MSPTTATLVFRDREDRLSLFDEAIGKRFPSKNMKKLIGEFIYAADLLPLNPVIDVGNSEEWKEGPVDEPLRLVSVSPQGDVIRVFCFGCTTSRAGLHFAIRFSIHKFPHNYAMVRDAVAEFNNAKALRSSALMRGRSMKPPYVNGGPAKGSHVFSAR